MRKFLLLSLLCAPAWAQYVTITGTVQGSNLGPYANGTVSARVNVAAGTKVTLTNGNLLMKPGTIPIPYDSTQGFSATMDANGFFSIQLYPNSGLSPAGTKWTLRVCSAQPDQNCFSTDQTITVANDLSATLSALAPAVYATTTPSLKLGSGDVTFSDGTVQHTAGGGATLATITGGTQGKTTVGNSTGNQFSDGLLSLDACAFHSNGTAHCNDGTGSDMCTDILLAYATAAPLLGVNATSYTGTHACSVNPFPVSGNATPLYLSPDVLIQAAVPWVIPTATPVFGADLPSSSAPGTVLQATSALESLRVASIVSYAGSGNIVVFTVNNAWAAGQTIALSGFGGGDTFLNGQNVAVCPGASCGNSGVGITPTTFTATVTGCALSCSGGAGTGTANVPLLTWGNFGSGGSGGVGGGGQFNAGVTSLRVDCNSKAVTGAYVYAAQEHSYLRNSHVIDCGNATNAANMVEIQSSHSQHFTLDHVQIFNKTATSCNANDHLIVINGGIDFSLDYATLTIQGCDSSIAAAQMPTTEVTIDGSQGILFGPHYIHMEGPQGSAPSGSPPALFAIRIGDTTGNTGVRIQNMSGGNFQFTGSGSTGIEIANNSNKSIDIEAQAMKGSQITNDIVDNQNGNTITRANNTAFNYYKFNDGVPETDATWESGITSAWIHPKTNGSLGSLLASGGAGAASSFLTSPTANGTYLMAYSVTGAAAVNPAASIVGYKGRAVTGTTATDTILYSDAVLPVMYQGSVAVAVTLPTGTTLGNSSFAVELINNLSTNNDVTVNASATWTFPGGGSSLVIHQGSGCRIFVDPGGVSWDDICYQIGFPQTVAGTVTSGGVPCFTSTTQMSSSAIMSSGRIMLGGGAGACPAVTTGWSVSGATTITAASSGLFDASAATSANAFKIPSQAGLTSNGVSSVAYDTTGKLTHIPTNGVDSTAQGVVAATGAVTTGSGSSIAATSLCSTTACPAGTYEVSVYVDVTTACSTGGSYIVWLGYTDDAGAKTGSSTTTFFALNGNGVTQSTGSLALASTANYGQATYIVRTTGAATGGLGAINYGTSAGSGCATGGPMIGKMYLTVSRLN